jgi:hypothetical protein
MSFRVENSLLEKLNVSFYVPTLQLSNMEEISNELYKKTLSNKDSHEALLAISVGAKSLKQKTGVLVQCSISPVNNSKEIEFRTEAQGILDEHQFNTFKSELMREYIHLEKTKITLNECSLAFKRINPEIEFLIIFMINYQEQPLFIGYNLKHDGWFNQFLVEIDSMVDCKTQQVKNTNEKYNSDPKSVSKNSRPQKKADYDFPVGFTIFFGISLLVCIHGIFNASSTLLKLVLCTGIIGNAMIYCFFRSIWPK